MAIKGFSVPQNAFEEFLAKVSADLGSRELGKIVSLRREKDELLVVFSKLGTSEIRYQIQDAGGNTQVTLKSEKIAFAHKPFRGEMEAKLGSILAKNGAAVTQS